MSRDRSSSELTVRADVYGTGNTQRMSPATARRFLRWALTDPDSPATRRRIESLRAGLHAAGFCRECGRTLSDPHSVEVGIGPDCRRRLEAAS